MIRLANYPTLAAIARERTAAARLDQRACKYLYESRLATIDLAKVSPDEVALTEKLGVRLPVSGPPDQSCSLE